MWVQVCIWCYVMRTWTYMMSICVFIVCTCMYMWYDMDRIICNMFILHSAHTGEYWSCLAVTFPSSTVRGDSREELCVLTAMSTHAIGQQCRYLIKYFVSKSHAQCYIIVWWDSNMSATTFEHGGIWYEHDVSNSVLYQKVASGSYIRV